VINANFYDYRPIAGMPSPFTDGATILPIDAIQEFNLEENPKAEYGWRPGAVVNAGVKSGTNTLHGTAYAFGRDQSWDARNVFNTAPQPKLPTALKQFGGVVGGPIKKDKLFFFAGYEGLRSFVGNALGTSIPATGTLGGGANGAKNSMVDALNALTAATVPISPVSTQLFGCTQTAPFACTGGVIQGASANTTIYTSGFPNTNVSDNGIAKLDYRLNDKHEVNGVLIIGRYAGDGEDHPIVNSSWKNGVPIQTYTATANWIWTPNSRWVSDARFGYDHVYFAFTIDDGTKFANGTDYPLNTGITTVGGFPTVIVTGFAPLGGWRGRPLYFKNPYSSFQDSLSYLRGKHAFKFGGEFTHIVTDFNVHDTRGRVDFQGGQVSNAAFACPPPKTGSCSTPLEDFFAGNPSRGFQLVGDTARHLTWTETAGFVQDDWRLTQRLMVNLGLRYSYISPMKEANNLVGSFDPTLGMVQQGQPGLNTLWKPDHKNFSPRVGFAWDVTGRGTTVVRGGASLIYSMFTTAQFTQSPFQNFKNGTIAAVPTGACTTVVAIGAPCPATFGGTINAGTVGLRASSLNWSGPVFPTGAGIACLAPKNLCDLTTVNRNLVMPYLVNWNLGVTHAFTNNLSLEVGYVGTHGARLTGFVDLNQFDPTSPAEIACGHCEANADRPFGGPSQFPYLRFINQTVNDARSNYNSLQATLTERVSHGLSFTSGYTYGHGLDNGSLNRFGNVPQNSRNPGAEYGNSDFDIRNRFTFTASYELPGKKGFAQLLEGWKINSILTLQGGLPWLVDDQANDFSGSGDLGDRWDFFGNPADFRSGSSSIPYCTGFGKTVTCSTTSGISGIAAALPASLGAKCTAVAPDPTTLATAGCFVSGNSVMVPPVFGTFGTMGRNIFRDSGFKDVDFSIFKTFSFKERFGAQFRVELFNVFNHPIIANPYGASNGWGGGNDPGSSPSTFGDGLATPDVAAGNPLVGSGSSRVMQLGLKIMF
jgi:hypothetical protein